MIEFALIVGLFLFVRRLRRAARTPQQPIEIHVYHHYPDDDPDDGEEIINDGEIVWQTTGTDNVIPFRKAS